MQDTALVPATNLREMLGTALLDNGHLPVELQIDPDDVDTGGEGKTVTTGHATFLTDESPHPVAFDFDVNVGTSKDEIVVFEELEVIIYMGAY